MRMFSYFLVFYEHNKSHFMSYYPRSSEGMTSIKNLMLCLHCNQVLQSYKCLPRRNSGTSRARVDSQIPAFCGDSVLINPWSKGRVVIWTCSREGKVCPAQFLVLFKNKIGHRNWGVRLGGEEYLGLGPGLRVAPFVFLTKKKLKQKKKHRCSCEVSKS